MHWKSLSRPKFEMVNGGGLLQVPTAFSGRYVEFVQSSAFGQKRSDVVVPESSRSRPVALLHNHAKGEAE